MRRAGLAVCCSSGDWGSVNSSPKPGVPAIPNVNFPASSPSVLACGGTRLLAGGASADARPKSRGMSAARRVDGDGRRRQRILRRGRSCRATSSCVPRANVARPRPWERGGTRRTGRRGQRRLSSGPRSRSPARSSSVSERAPRPRFARRCSRAWPRRSTTRSRAWRAGCTPPTRRRAAGPVTKGDNDVADGTVAFYEPDQAWNACTGLGALDGEKVVTTLVQTRHAEHDAVMSTATSLETGRVLAERYRVERQAGEGGMAIVFEATDLKHGRRVALKVLRPEIATHLAHERFRREIQLAATLSHPNIVPMYESGESDGLLFYVMPFVTGETLSDSSRARGQAPDRRRVAHHARGRARAFVRARRGHRAPRSQAGQHHVVRRRRGRHRLRHRASRRRRDAAAADANGIGVGTPAYMSPEQAMGDAAIYGGERSVQSGVRRVRDAQRPDSVPGVDDARDARAAQLDGRSGRSSVARRRSAAGRRCTGESRSPRIRRTGFRTSMRSCASSAAQRRVRIGAAERLAETPPKSVAIGAATHRRCRSRLLVRRAARPRRRRRDDRRSSPC